MFRSHFPGGPVFEATPEPGPLSPDYVAPEPAAETAWQGPSQEEWERIASGYEQVSQLPSQLEQIAQMAQPQPQGIEYPDPFADDYHQQLDAWFERKSAPFMHAQQTWEQNEGTERAKDILNDNVSQAGEFILPGSSDKALRLAEAYLPEMQGRYGSTAQAAEQAIIAAANEIRDYERQVGEAFHQRQMNQLKRLDDAPREPGSPAATAVQTTGTPRGGDEMSVVQAFGGFGR